MAVMANVPLWGRHLPGSLEHRPGLGCRDKKAKRGQSEQCAVAAAREHVDDV